MTRCKAPRIRHRWQHGHTVHHIAEGTLGTVYGQVYVPPTSVRVEYCPHCRTTRFVVGDTVPPHERRKERANGTDQQDATSEAQPTGTTTAVENVRRGSRYAKAVSWPGFWR